MIFDWGFAGPIRADCCREQAVLSHFYQVVEHMDFGARDCSFLYEAIYHLRQGKDIAAIDPAIEIDCE